MKREGRDPGSPTAATDDRKVSEVPLELKDRALSVAAEGITISDLRLPDEPLIYANDGFERLTFYPVEDILGKNCRFLQGPDTDESVVEEIRKAISERKECTVEILNYRKDGKPFWNRLSVTPVRDDAGEATHYIGVQSDITKRREAELALLQANKKLEETNQRIILDLEAAARVQKSLLPPELPEFKEVKISWVFEPCDELAGDTLNVFSLSEEHLAFYTLDVSGHGVPAALLSVSLSHWLSPTPGRSCLFSPAADSDSEFTVSSPGQVAESLNQQFPMDMDNIQYFTITYGILDRSSGRLTYVVAGSPRPLLMSRNGKTRTLEGEGFPIGMVPGAKYQEQTMDLSPGDRLFLYTDGIIEAENAAHEEFLTERLSAVVENSSTRPLEECLTTVLAGVKDWTAGGRLKDDATVLALEYRSPKKERRR